MTRPFASVSPPEKWSSKTQATYRESRSPGGKVRCEATGRKVNANWTSDGLVVTGRGTVPPGTLHWVEELNILLQSHETNSFNKFNSV